MVTETLQYDDYDASVSFDNVDLPTGYYYYYFDETLDNIRELDGFIGNCPDVVGCFLNPYLKVGKTYKIPYDMDRYVGDGYILGGVSSQKPNVYRIAELPDQRVFRTALVTMKNASEKVKLLKSGLKPRQSVSYESRLQFEPYRTLFLMGFSGCNEELLPSLLEYSWDDNLSGTGLLKQGEPVLKNGDKVSCIYSVTSLGESDTKASYVKGYKNDDWGQLELIIDPNNTDIPCSSDAFAMYSATQRAQTEHNVQSQILQLQNTHLTNVHENTDLAKAQNITQSGLGTVSSLATLNPFGAINNATNGWFNHVGIQNQISQNERQFRISQAQVIGSKSAMMKDISNTPRTQISRGSNIYFNIGAYTLQHWSLDYRMFEYTITDDWSRRVGDYFAQYGTKCSKMTDYINLRSRRDYNYIKTIGANVTNIHVNDDIIPKEHLETLKKIFDGGVTIWHQDRNNGFLNYQYDNTEMSIINS